MTCEQFGGAVKVMASIEDPIVIKKTLEHLDRRAEPATSACRAVACLRTAAIGITGPEGTGLTVLH